MHTPTRILLMSLVVAGAVPLSGCDLTEGLGAQEGAVHAIVMDETFSTANGCGPKAFAKYVLPQLKANCAECHGGLGPGVGNFAVNEMQIAYSAARARTVLFNPAQSMLVDRSSEDDHGDDCVACGEEWGANLTNIIATWTKGEMNNEEICTPLMQSTGPGGSGDEGGTPEVANVEVIPAGLAEFSKTDGIHKLLKDNCIDCHIEGKRAAFAPFATADQIEAYKAAKIRNNFIDVSLSALINRAGLDEHGSGDCTICGDEDFVAELQDALELWKGQEAAGVAASRVTLTAKAIGATSTVKTLSWVLSTTSVPAMPELAGATFTIDVRISPQSAFAYRFSNPRIITATNGVYLRSMGFIVNGTENILLTTYKKVEANVAAGNATPGLQLSTSAALVPVSNAATDTVGFSFAIMRKP